MSGITENCGHISSGCVTNDLDPIRAPSATTHPIEGCVYSTKYHCLALHYSWNTYGSEKFQKTPAYLVIVSGLCSG